uniref:Uncharacterized protein n=1 Tax=uncultured Armatimonadetes bacterium TaxID=157466 RepID=A0A6J4HP01_9BACT|nr:hypothetical protein AVDCRST_MAG63-816 [uncultured Armatimonadetes bacterium]
MGVTARKEGMQVGPAPFVSRTRHNISISKSSSTTRQSFST